MTRSDHRVARRRFFRPLLEPLEDRRLLATITVTSADDTIAVDGLVTLREAITSANNNAAANADVVTVEPYETVESDSIHFTIPGTGVHTIHVGGTGLGPLPIISGPVVIDGYTQPGSSVNTNSVESLLGLNAVLKIELDGTSAGGESEGLRIHNVGGSTIRGLVINRFTGRGISLAVSNNNVIEGNFVGTDASGTLDLGNNIAGIELGGEVRDNRIGGTKAAARNLISGNNQGGLTLGAVGQSNLVLGNLIGTDITGTQDLGNGGSGVDLGGGRDNSGTTIGGATSGARNIISGNSSDGISFNRISGILVQGNYVGTDVTGTVAIANGNNGVALRESSGITIGGSTPLARNVISGNLGAGVVAGAPVGNNPSSALVIGNFVGTQADGISPLGNRSIGVDAFISKVGGLAPGEGNVVAHNGSFGVIGGQVLGNTIFGNSSPGVLVEGLGRPILGNSIFANGGLGIDLDRNGVTPNDPGDTDGNNVSNNGQNFPVLLEVLSTAVDSTIFARLNSLAQTDFLIQFFANDVADPSGHGEGQTFLGEKIVHTNSAGNASFSAEVPLLLAPGQQVTATATRLFDHDSNPDTPQVPTDTSEFSQAISGTTSILELDGPTIERDLPLGQEITFRLNVPPGTDARLTAHFADPRIGEILVSVGDLPDVNSFAERVVAFVNPDPEFLLAGSPAPYFIRVRGASTANVPLGHFSLTAESIGMEIDRVAPNRGSNAGQVTTTIFGTGFSPETVFSLIGNGVERPAASIVLQSETSAFATFNLVGLAPGSYTLRAVEGDGSSELAGAFTVTSGNPGRFEARLVTPNRILQGRESVLVVEYANLGETDVPAPLLIVESINSFMLPRQVHTSVGIITIPPPLPPEPVAQFLAISQTGPAGVLPPGARERLEVRFKDDGSDAPNFHPTLSFDLRVAEREGLVFHQLASVKDDLRPPGVSLAAWDVVFDNFLTRFRSGPNITVGRFIDALRDAATYLSRYGIYTSDIERLLSFHFAQADNSLPGGTLHSTTDAVAPVPGVPLDWGRSFGTTISRRFDLGILGRGWSHPWDLTLSRVAETNDVLIRAPNGTRRFSEPTTGNFIGSLLDPAQLTLQGGVFSLRETDGTVSRFSDVTGLLLDVTDRNGHQLALNYAAGKLASLLHSTGDRFDFSYNAAGRLTQLTDQSGRVTTYEYDAVGEHLIRVTGPDGVWEYAYETAAGAFHEHALESLTRPDGTHIFFEYDSQGRLVRASRDAGAEAVALAYGSVGEVFITDASNNSSSLFFNEIGQLLEARDALGRSTRLDYDAGRRLDRMTQPQHTISLFDFDDNGNLTSVVKPDGRSLGFTYDSTFNLPTAIRDERSNSLRYTYDAQGNVTGIIHADGSIDQFTPDQAGNITQSINRRNQAIDYTYDDRGLVLRKDHADGTFEEFTYDDRGNRLTATDEAGTTTFTYDTADRMTKVTYADGRFLQYTYDAGGRRIQLEDQTGFVVKYLYDAVGRIVELKDASDARLVRYAYDPAGRLVREDNGNLTFSTYEFDELGLLTSLANHLPDGTVSSRFDYTYDALGRRTSLTTLDGLTTFGYDAIGQLTLVILPDGRTIQYQYDAAGNRTAVIDNGVTTNYQLNKLNQYVRIGSFDRTYDADGNLTTDASGGSGSATYTYDDESRLLGWVDGLLSVGYEYDALGIRIAKTEGGVRTEYLVDPLGLTNVVAEFDSAGNLVARYVHGGFGLVSRHDHSGTAAFYDFDGAGSTVTMTDAGANIVNSYSYLPFGEALAINESIANPFEFVGQYGVQREENGLDFMRARYYSSEDGRFINEDPIGIAGGLNLYRYVDNQPHSFIDPLGFGKIGLAFKVFKNNLWDEVDNLPRSWDNAVDEVNTTPDADITDVDAPVDTRDTDIDTDLDPNNSTLPAITPFDVVSLLDPTPFSDAYDITGAVVDLLDTDNFELGDLACDLVDCDEPDFDIPSPPGTPIDDDSTQQVGSLDPNDIIGPAGVGPDQFLPADSTLFYTIRFENLAAATAPAQTVVVTQTLDSDLDLLTFELISFGIGPSVVNLPAGRSSSLQRFDLRPDKNLLLDIGGELNVETGVITWTFTSLDPATLDLPADAEGDIGFLPPNLNPPAGEGFVTYIVRPKPALPTGTRIDAQARIVFDLNAPIDTPAIFHTLDAGPPTSSVDPLAATIDTASFPLSWSGADDPNGSGISLFDIFVSVDGGPFTPFLLDSTETSAIFNGAAGHTYAFYSVATDNVGHTEDPPTTADATTSVVVVGADGDFGDAPDSYRTLLASGGAMHLSGSALRLGSEREGEADGQPGLMADGDDLTGTSDDEDGVALPTVLIARLNATATVVASQFGQLDAWIDFNGNGTFETAEQIAVDLDLVAGANTVTFAVPADARAGFTYARFRLSSAGGLGPTGTADDGEIEDYRLLIDTVLDRGSRVFPDPENPGQNVWVVVGTTANDRIEFVRPNKFGNVLVKRNGRMFSAAHLAQFNRLAVFGLAGNDEISVHSRIVKRADLFGDSGNDKLSGGKGNDRLFGGAGDDRIFGNLGIDILLGGLGTDRLDGGRGRDLLIGGAGRDKLFGHEDDDLLVAGTTSHDQVARALAAILAEWTSSRDYANRATNIRAGVGPVLAGTGIFLKPGISVEDDGARDELFGGSGKDWFFASLVQDKLSRARSEQIQ